MRSRFFEVVFEGDEDYIQGLFEGFTLGEKEYLKYYSSRESGVKTETFFELVKEWVSFKARIHHIIVEEKLYNELILAIKESGDHHKFDPDTIKSAKSIKGATFKFKFITFGRKYGDDIRALFDNVPEKLELKDYDINEKILPDGKGIELYTPEHEYTLEGNGAVEGEIDSLIDFRNNVVDNLLIEAEEIILSF